MTTTAPNEVLVTGIGLISSLGEGVSAHLAALDNPSGPPHVDSQTYAPYSVHPLAAIDMSRQIAKKSDLKQMEPWQRIGVYAAGLALDDAGIARDPQQLAQTHLVVAAGSGERDTAVDAKVLEAIAARGDTDVLAKEILPTALRPTLFLAQLSNLLAGNISIVHSVTASSRTFMGEEMAGFSAMENAVRRIAAGQADMVLVGGALNAEREDLLLGYELGCNLWSRSVAPVTERNAAGGGFVPGSAGAFLVLESRQHAEARGARVYARIDEVVTDRARRSREGDICNTLEAMLDRASAGVGGTPKAVLSGACGAEPATSQELEFLRRLAAPAHHMPVRIYADRFGHTVEAHFPLGVALAALALERGRLFAPMSGVGAQEAADTPLQCVLVTGVGHWRGEGLALMTRVGEEKRS